MFKCPIKFEFWWGLCVSVPNNTVHQWFVPTGDGVVAVKTEKELPTTLIDISDEYWCSSEELETQAKSKSERFNHIKSFIPSNISKVTSPSNFNLAFLNLDQAPNIITIPTKEHNGHRGILYNCKECDKSFKTKVTLSRHEKIHRGNAFPCPKCSKVFYQISNVKHHVKAVHGNHYEEFITEKNYWVKIRWTDILYFYS